MKPRPWTFGRIHYELDQYYLESPDGCWVAAVGYVPSTNHDTTAREAAIAILTYLSHGPKTQAARRRLLGAS